MPLEPEASRVVNIIVRESCVRPLGRGTLRAGRTRSSLCPCNLRTVNDILWATKGDKRNFFVVGLYTLLS